MALRAKGTDQRQPDCARGASYEYLHQNLLLVGMRGSAAFVFKWPFFWAKIKHQEWINSMYHGAILIWPGNEPSPEMARARRRKGNRSDILTTDRKHRRAI
jgi:hypothetical protein